ncbi:MAG: VCBS repeat-containing protein [Candidatus Marinimicrobia bacterium]|nr:VCBS repeat-containing protein [Candidatus Neomarinimicrobiota bacterium]
MILVFILTVGAELSAQTEVSGIISSDTTWTQAMSPIIITGEVTVNSGVTLTVDPGVTVLLNSGLSLTIDGSLRAIGTVTDSITFTANTATPMPGFWGGVVFNSSSSNDTLEYCKMEYGWQVITVYSTSSILIKHCMIINNEDRSIHLRNGASPTIMNNIISNNGYGIVGWPNCSPLIEDNIITNNSVHGLNFDFSSNPTIRGNVISNNGWGIVAVNNCSPIIEDNIIRNNIGGIYTYGYASPMIIHNTITGNQYGIYSNYEFSPEEGTWPPIYYNNIYANVYNFYNRTTQNVDAASNWWGTTNTDSIDAHIWDYNDDQSAGTINYTPVLNVPDTDSPSIPYYISISRDSLNFGLTRMDSTKNLQFNVYNYGTDGTLEVTNITSSGGEFVPTPTSASISPGDASTITINFTPTDMLTYSDSLTIFSNDPNNPQVTLYVSGTGDPIVAHTPAQNALNVSQSTDISVTFGVAINLATINANTYVIHASQTGLHTGAYSYDSGTKTATFYPDTDFNVGEVVNVTLTTGIQNILGNPIPNSYNWSFTIESIDGSGVFAVAEDVGVGSTPTSVTSGDFDGDSDLDLAVTNGNSNTVSILINDGSGNFTQTTTLGVGGYPRSVSAGDFDGDGDMDLAVANESSNTISILKNDGNANFTQSSTLGVGSGPFRVSIGDYDGDGDLDLAVPNHGSNTVSILVNDGSGSFTEISTVDVGNQPVGVAAGDLDGDGDLDLAVSNWGGGSGTTVSILMNDGSGSFTQSFTVVVGSGPTGVYSGDYDGDGDLDLAVANQYSNTLSILTNNGTGSFTESSTIEVGNYPARVTTGDFDGDGDLDLAVANWGQGSGTTVSILTNDGSGSFTKSEVQVRNGPITPTAADFDGDGDLDLAVSNSGSNTVSILENLPVVQDIEVSTTLLTFGVIQSNSSKSLTFRIFNQGGLNQLNVSSISGSLPSIFSVTPSSGIINAQDTLTITVTFTPSEGIIYNDSLTISSDDPDEPTVTVSLTGIGAPTVTSFSPDRNSHNATETADISATFNSNMSTNTIDNNSFLAFGEISGKHNGVISYDFATKTAAFNPDSNFVFGEKVQVVLTEDVKSDPDAISLINGYSWKFGVAPLFGSGDFTLDVTSYITGATPFDIATGDFDGDGYSDYVVANSGENSVSVFLNDQSGGFSLSATYNVGANPQGVTVADVDADGYTDIIVSNNSDNNVSVLINDGTGSFGTATNHSVGTGPRAVASADLDNDGNLDIVTGNVTGNNISILSSVRLK